MSIRRLVSKKVNSMRWEAMTKGLIVAVIVAAGNIALAQATAEESEQAPQAQPTPQQQSPSRGAQPVRPNTSTRAPQPQQPKPAAPPVDLENAPRLKVEPEEWAFGEVWSGTPLETELTITNVGKGTLKLQKPKTSCGCTGSVTGKNELAPGESTKLKITYNTKKNARNVRQKVRIGSNDPVEPTKVVELHGVVKPIFDFQPSRSPMVSFGQVGANEAKTQELIIKNVYAESEGGKKIKLTLPNTKVRNYDVKLEEIKPGMEYKLIAKTLPPLPTGSVAGSVALQTDLPFMKTLQVRLNAFVMPKVKVNPNILYVSPKLSFPSTKNLTMVYKAGVDFKIEKIECDSDKVTWETVEQPNQQQRGVRSYQRLKVTVPPGEEIPDKGFILTITTNQEEPEYKTIKIPIRKTPDRQQRASRNVRPVQTSPQVLKQVPPAKEDKPAEKKESAKGETTKPAAG
jgi:hypothetical protein